MTHEENCPGGVCDCDNPVPISRPVTPHDKLLDAVKPEYAYGKIGDALRAVVELHKPISSWVYDELVENHHCSCDEWNEYDMGYPCETIQVIEKELE